MHRTPGYSSCFMKLSKERRVSFSSLFRVTNTSHHVEATLLPSTSSAHSAAIHSFSAAAAGAVATLTTHPFDVIKTKVQVRSEDKYHGLFRTAMTIQKVFIIPSRTLPCIVLTKLVATWIGWILRRSHIADDTKSFQLCRWLGRV
jgi:hypothetical protein